MRPTPRRLRPSALLAALAAHPAAAPALTGPAVSATYGDLAASVRRAAAALPARASPRPAHAPPPRVALLAPPAPAAAAALLASWAAGRAAVPQPAAAPRAAAAAAVQDCGAEAVVGVGAAAAAVAKEVAEGAGCGFVRLPVEREREGIGLWDEVGKEAEAEAGEEARAWLAAVAADVPAARPAMLLYTSGTTGAPKGAVWTHAMVDYQVAMLANEWRWSPRDRLLNVLPLHHVQGAVNVLLTCLYAGAHCEMLPAFDSEAVWSALRRDRGAPTVFMAVPTVYHRLIEWYEAAPEAEKPAMRTAAAALRLYVCGSAALSPSAAAAWHRISGHSMLERYGMTETGMLLSNGYEDRVPTSLGVPLPGVEVRVVSDARESGDSARISGNSDTDMDAEVNVDSGASAGAGAVADVEGELLVRGPGVFSEYWNRADATAAAFDADGWFRTGDVVRMEVDTQRCFMLGRASTDIMKSGGYKLSALEIEDQLAEHPDVRASAVFGVDDEALGQRVACVVVPRQSPSSLTAATVTAWLGDRLPRYKVPRLVRIVDEDGIPRNALGKVQKKLLVGQYGRLSSSAELDSSKLY